ncbi:MAG: aminodeoxychorismate lyase, partial [Candidatus Thioglobus sp.]|nr:aminodeoxychorismate lyase [Candidatus Thioglobus sp.]
MKDVVLINGKKQSKLSVFSRVTQFGDGLFETCLVKDGRLLFWSEHFYRLEKGREKLKINKVESALWLKDVAKALSISRLDNAVVKIILSRGESLRGYGFDQDIIPNRIVIVSGLPEQIPEQYSLSLCQSGYSTNRLLSGIKHSNRLEQIMARFDMSTNECIMLDDSGYVISTTQANIFSIKSNVLLTPALDECGIEGTRRKVILELARELGLQVEVGALSINELLESDEVFITNSVIGIKSVSKINQQSFDLHTTTEKIKHAFFSLQKLSASSQVIETRKSVASWAIALSV